VHENAGFVIDTSRLPARKDFLNDVYGSFRNLGQHGRISNVVNGKVASARPLERSAKNRSRLKENEYLTKVVYWAHKKYSDFKRRIYEVTSVKGDAVLVFVQYSFEKQEHAVSPCKKIHSTKQKIRERVTSSKTPSAIFDDLFEEAGGMNYKNSSDLPRSIAHIKYE